MGYSYTRNWKTNKLVLCCDFCGEGNGNTRKYNICPYNYCPKVALCPKCKATHHELFTKETHKECKIAHEEFTLQQLTEKILLDSGKYLRCSALGVDHKVHVIFRNSHNETIGYYMSNETYGAIPLLTPATPEHYAMFGEITPTSNQYYK